MAKRVSIALQVIHINEQKTINSCIYYSYYGSIITYIKYVERKALTKIKSLYI